MCGSYVGIGAGDGSSIVLNSWSIGTLIMQTMNQGVQDQDAFGSGEKKTERGNHVL